MVIVRTKATTVQLPVEMENSVALLMENVFHPHGNATLMLIVPEEPTS